MDRRTGGDDPILREGGSFRRSRGARFAGWL